MDKNTCPKCGKACDEGSKHCSKCKTVLTASAKEAKTRVKAADDNFSARIHETSAPDIKPNPEILSANIKMSPSKNSSSFAGVVGKVIASLVLIAAAGSGLWYFNAKDDLLLKTKACLNYCEGNTVTVSVPGDSFIPFCKDKSEVKLFYHSFKINDEYEIENMLRDKRMLYLDYYTKLLIINKDLAYAKVRVLDGKLKGQSGWVYLVEVSQFDQQKNANKTALSVQSASAGQKS